MSKSTPEHIQLPLFDTVEIPLTKGKTAIVDAIDSDLLSLRWRARLNKSGNRFYANRSPRHRKTMEMHRIILERKLGRPLETGEECDHIDNNSLNNCRSNLRLATHKQNTRNSKRRINNTSGYKGVSLNKQSRKWQASIVVNGKQLYLGLYPSASEAYQAYCEASKKYHGEFGRIK